jgi:hypothetical protein
MKLFERRRRLAIALLASVAVAASCSYGNYDGGYDGGPPDGSAVSVGETVLLTRAIDPTKQEVLTTPDGVLELTIPVGAYPGGTTITISRLADRTIENSFVVPVYSVTGAPEANVPVQVIMRGNSAAGGDTTRTLVAGVRGPSGDFAPEALFGSGFSQGGSLTPWVFTRRLGVFSIVFLSISQTKLLSDVVTDSCLGKCCVTSGSGGGSGSANGASVAGGCGCPTSPNLACFLDACKDIDRVVNRCAELANNPSGQVACRPTIDPGCSGGGMCGFQSPCNVTTPPPPGVPSTGGGICCMQGRFSTCSSGSCPGMAIRCDLSTKCAAGTTCCVFENEAFCASSCPNNRTWCKAQSDCDGGVGEGGPSADGGACQLAPSCPHGTCGTPPIGCNLK